MYLSDEKALDYVTMAILLLFPSLGTLLGMWSWWGWMWDTSLLLTVFWLGFRRGIGYTAILLSVGYGLAILVFRSAALAQIEFVPWAALLAVAGWRKWPLRVAFFWGILLAGVLGVLPTLSIIYQGTHLPVNQLVNSIMEYYRSIGLFPLMQQWGVSEGQFKEMLEQTFPIYFLVLPSLAALSGIFEFGLAAYLVQRWFMKGKLKAIPFSRWRLPWYAVWGVIIALAGYLIGDYYSWTILKAFGINLMIIYAVLSFVLGLSVYTFFLKSPRIPRLVKWVMIIINFIYFLFSIISLVMFGLFDMVLNFRKLPETDTISD